MVLDSLIIAWSKNKIKFRIGSLLGMFNEIFATVLFVKTENIMLKIHLNHKPNLSNWDLVSVPSFQATHS